MPAWKYEASDFDTDRAEEVGQVLRRAFRRRGLAKVSERERIASAWARLLGPDAAHTRIEGLRKGVMTVSVDSSTLLSELNNFRRQELLEGLRRDVKTYFIGDVRLQLIKRRPPAGGGRPAEGKRRDA